MTMCDEILADLSNPQKRVTGFNKIQLERLPNGKTKTHSGKSAAMRCIKDMREAVRYVITDDLLEYLIPVFSTIKSDRLIDSIIESRLPHNKVWIEWNEVSRQTLMQDFAKENNIPTNFFPTDEITPNVGYLLMEAPDAQDVAWLAQSFANGKNTGANVQHLKGTTTLAPFGFAVYPELDSPLKNNIEIEIDEDNYWKASTPNPELNVAFELSSAALGHGYLQTQSHWRKPQDLADVFSGLGIWQSYSSEWLNQKNADRWVKNSAVMMGADARFLICVLAVLNYDWIIKDDVEPRKSTRKLRHGKPLPRMSHVTLTIDLPKMRGVTMLPTAHIDGASRRLHEVRGHWRRYRKTGKRVWVKSHRRGDAKLGIITKDYVLDAA